ncbi:MAG: DUF924 domain-containing protein [Nevskia sp.]|nr:DUF924 domain-containing protein [Nevskia sp.]
MTRRQPDPEQVLQFWFGESRDEAQIAREKSALWWEGGAEVDSLIRERFGALRRQAIQGGLAGREPTARGRLALVLLVDQFSRNIFRGRLEAFSHDALARRWCLEGIAQGHDRLLLRIERSFFYLPLEHSESRHDQTLSVELHTALAAEAGGGEAEGYLDYARRHHDIVERFGRFPHRNAILGRESTAEELEFLRQPGSSF